jgi:integrase
LSLAAGVPLGNRAQEKIDSSKGRGLKLRCRREGISLLVVQRQLGHADLAITSRYLRGIDNTETIQAVHERREPTIRGGRQLLPGP